jgi:hypothetical protein
MSLTLFRVNPHLTVSDMAAGHGIGPRRVKTYSPTGRPRPKEADLKRFRPEDPFTEGALLSRYALSTF